MSDIPPALANFFRAGKIAQIPARAAKRRALAHWLAGLFELGREYAEAEVNAVIHRYHDDFATLRREMIDAGFMTRKDGRYRRTEHAPDTESAFSKEPLK